MLDLTLRGLAWGIVAVVFVALRWPPPASRIINADELIPLRVSEAMMRIGWLDPNWVHADLPLGLNYPQYNFYLYNIVAHGVARAASMFSFDALTALRAANILFQGAALALLLLALARWRIGGVAVAATAIFVTVAPSLVQDAQMARPESFLYLLCALGVAAASLRGTFAQSAGVGFVCGLGSAVKVTFPIVGLAALLAFVFFHRATVQRAAVALGSFGAAALLGFFLGAPFAVINWPATLNGIAVLQHQYDGFLPPHSLIDPTFMDELSWISTYFWQLNWSCFLFAGLALVFGSRTERLAVLALTAPFLALVLYFATKTVFFERNLAHAFVPVLLAGGLGVQATVRKLNVSALGATLCLALALGPGLYWSIKVTEAGANAVRLASKFESRRQLTHFQHVPVEQTFVRPRNLQQCGWLEVDGFNDARTARYRSELIRLGFVEVAHFTGAFSHLVTSTLQLYLSRDRYYFERPCARLRPRDRSMSDSWSSGGEENAFGESVFGDTLGSYDPTGDEGVGSARAVYAVIHQRRALLLPVLTGPRGERQSLKLLGPGGAFIAEVPLEDASASWRLVRILAPRGGFPPVIVVEGADSGDQWGEWMAFGDPLQEPASAGSQ